MLSRVADSLYWINRFVERAENISRFLEVSEAMALDNPSGNAEPWLPLIDASGDRQLFDQVVVFVIAHVQMFAVFRQHTQLLDKLDPAASSAVATHF